MSERVLLDRIVEMLESCSGDKPLLPRTNLFSEGWMLRLVLDWFSNHRSVDWHLQFPKDGRWFSEIQLLPAFPRKPGGKVLGEGPTNADGAIGHFKPGNRGKRDLALCTDATHLVIVEAKMFSKLSGGVTNAKYFDQAARTVACIAKALSNADRRPADMTHLGFYLLAPQKQIAEENAFEAMGRKSMHTKVKQRAEEYGEDLGEWLSRWFEPTFERLETKVLPWECVVDLIEGHDPGFADPLSEFYRRCVEYNEPKSR